MSAEAEAGGRIGSFGALARFKADLEGTFREAGDTGRAYAERILAHLEDMAQQLDALSTSDERRNIQGNKQAVGATDTVELEAPRPGYFWVIKAVVIQVPAAAGPVTLYVGTTTRAGVRKIMSVAAQGFSDPGSVDIWVPSGAKVFITISGLNVGDAITANLEVIQYKRTPEPQEPERI